MKSDDGLDSKYGYVVVAARRARQLQSGSQPRIASRSSKACRVAQEEIAAGKVTFTRPHSAELAEDAHGPDSIDPPEET